jgi:hypothetical protein
MHKVTYDKSSDLTVYKGFLKIFEGELKFRQSGTGSGRSVFVRKYGTLVVNAGKLILPIQNSSGGNASGNFTNEEGKVEFISSTIEIAQDFTTEEDASNKILESCVKVGEDYKNEDSKETIDRSCIEIGLQGSGNFENDKGDIRVNLASILLRGTSGNFSNESGGSKIRKIAGSTMGFTALDMPGNLNNSGTWDAPVQNYCVGGGIQGSRSWDIDFTAPENCTAVNVTNCDCDNVPTQVMQGTWSQVTYEREICEVPEICSKAINYFFDSTINGVNIPWPDVNGPGVYGKVTVGGFNYTEAEGRAIFAIPNNANGIMPAAKRGFIAMATLKLSGTAYLFEPDLLLHVNIVQPWLALQGKISPNNCPGNSLLGNVLGVYNSAGAINDWIWVNKCPDRR